MFFRVTTINISANTEVKTLSIREGINIQKTIRAFPGSIIIYVVKCGNP